MEQPELGRKIAELRKLKGLTQDELVKMCNLNVRTLQRIESGQVMPRTYTIKIIFTALEYEYYLPDESVIKDTVNKTYVLTNRLEQTYRYFYNLFNLKKHTMKKLSLLSLLIVSSILLMTNFSSNAQISLKGKNKLVGTWQIKAANYNGRELSLTNGNTKKYNSDGTFEVSQKLNGVDVTTQKGNCLLSNDSIYIEKIYQSVQGNDNSCYNTFIYTLKGDTFKLDGDIYIVVDADKMLYKKMKIKETWVKIQ